MIEIVLVPFLEAAVRTATPLAFAAIGELVAERSGVINLGLEGTIIAGCFGAAVMGAAGGAGAGYLGAALAGMLMAFIFALFVVAIKTDQIITGTALTLLGLGLTGTLHRTLPVFAGPASALPTTGPIPVPGLSQLPLIGSCLLYTSDAADE